MNVRKYRGCYRFVYIFYVITGQYFRWSNSVDFLACFIGTRAAIVCEVKLKDTVEIEQYQITTEHDKTYTVCIADEIYYKYKLMDENIETSMDGIKKLYTNFAQFLFYELCTRFCCALLGCDSLTHTLQGRFTSIRTIVQRLTLSLIVAKLRSGKEMVYFKYSHPHVHISEVQSVLI